jgi:hypothetical protein
MSQNPYRTSSAQSPLATASIPPAAVEPLSGAVMTLRIIIFALTQGVLVFGIVAVVQNWGKPQTLLGNWEPLNLIMLAMAVTLAPLAAVLPLVIFRQMTGSTAPHPHQQPAASDPEVATVLAIQGRWQAAAIIGAAMLEGAAFANLVAYLLSGELLNLIVAGVCLLGIAAFFPLPGSSERRIERELRRQREEAALQSFGGTKLP